MTDKPTPIHVGLDPKGNYLIEVYGSWNWRKHYIPKNHVAPHLKVCGEAVDLYTLSMVSSLSYNVITYAQIISNGRNPGYIYAVLNRPSNSVAMGRPYGYFREIKSGKYDDTWGLSRLHKAVFRPLNFEEKYWLPASRNPLLSPRFGRGCWGKLYMLPNGSHFVLPDMSVIRVAHTMYAHFIGEQPGGIPA